MRSPCFPYRGRHLYVENVPVHEIALRFGTPLYVYSQAALVTHLREYKKAFNGVRHLVCFALKANSNLTILRILAGEGAGADIVSGGELYKAVKAGFSPQKTVFAGVGKTEEEIRAAIRYGVLLLHLESEEELNLVSQVARDMKRTVTIGFRINPDIDAGTHPHIATGLSSNKFGVPLDTAVDHYRLAASLPYVRARGIHIHLGSQITAISPFRKALRKALNLIDRLYQFQINIEFLDIGGGFGIDYENAGPRLDPITLARSVKPLLQERSLTLILEPGRSIAANAGILVTRVLYRKEVRAKNFVIVDAGMNDLIRPCLYDAFHRIVPLAKRKGPEHDIDVVGPVCESADYLGKGRKMVRPYPGEYLAVLSAGAYGISMSSNYNSRPRPAEVLVNGKDMILIRSRETYDDLLSHEIV